MQTFLTALGKLWLAGGHVDWSSFYAPRQRRRIPLPTYPFERKRYYIEPHNGSTSVSEPVPDKPQTPELYVHPKSAQTYVAPENETERILADIWQELLGIRQVGIHDNFFELDGHSLLATMMVSRVRKSSGVELHVGEIFKAPTIHELALIVAQRVSEQHHRQNLARPEKLPRRTSPSVEK
jgi:acyl transferase domain-containing protein